MTLALCGRAVQTMRDEGRGKRQTGVEVARCIRVCMCKAVAAAQDARSAARNCAAPLRAPGS
eukprot:scaffold16445_cov135-Isochrysis_galbana.AAC.1